MHTTCFPRTSFGRRAALLLSLFSACSVFAAGLEKPQDWWQADVWADPKRPFLYYGEPPEKADDAEKPVAQEAPAPAPAPDRPLAALSSVQAIREESQARLERAVMDPTPERLAAYLEINDFMLGKSHAFAEKLSRVRLQHPEWDWTASHTTVNSATAELANLRRSAVAALLEAAAPELGLIFAAGGSDALTSLAAGPVGSFAARFGFSVMAVLPDDSFGGASGALTAVSKALSKKGRIPPEAAAALLPGLADRAALLLPGPDGQPKLSVVADNGLLAQLEGGSPIRPALYVAADPKGRLPILAGLRAAGPKRLATGPAAVEDLAARLAALILPMEDFSARAKWTGDLAADAARTLAAPPPSTPDPARLHEPHADLDPIAP